MKDIDDQLFDAVEQGDAKRVSDLLEKGADANAQDRYDRTPLLCLCVCEKGESPAVIEVFEVLIKAGADVNVKYAHDDMPLHHAAMHFENPVVIEAMLAKGANVKAKNVYGETPLHYAAMCNANPAVSEALLEKGADANAKDNNGKTPLFHAEMHNANPVVIDVIRARTGQATAQSAEDRLAMSNTGM